MLRFFRIVLVAGIVALTLPVGAGAKATPNGVPAITGTAKAGSTLTCNSPTWSSNDGGPAQASENDWRTYATGTARVRGSLARVRLHRLRRLRPGRYLVTIVASGGSSITVVRHYQRI